MSQWAVTYPAAALVRCTKIYDNKKEIIDLLSGSECTGDCTSNPAFTHSTCTWGSACGGPPDGWTAQYSCQQKSNAASTFGCDEPPSCITDIFDWNNCAWCYFTCAYNPCLAPDADKAAEAYEMYINVYNYYWICP